MRGAHGSEPPPPPCCLYIAVKPPHAACTQHGKATKGPANSSGAMWQLRMVYQHKVTNLKIGQPPERIFAV